MPGSASDQEKKTQIFPKRKPIRRAFGYAATPEFLNSWAARQNFCPDKTPSRRADRALREIFNRLPDGSRRVCLIHPRERSLVLITCIVVASNMRREDMQKALDQDWIKIFQEVLTTQEQPRWYPVADE